MMSNPAHIHDLVRSCAAKKILYLPHAVLQMSRSERLIRPEEIRNVIDKGEIIENYPEDPRGHSCLILGFGDANRPLHVVCSPKADYLAIITAYIPSPESWDSEYRKRETS